MSHRVLTLFLLALHFFVLHNAKAKDFVLKTQIALAMPRAAAPRSGGPLAAVELAIYIPAHVETDTRRSVQSVQSGCG